MFFCCWRTGAGGLSNKGLQHQPDSRKRESLTTLTDPRGGNRIKKRKGMSRGWYLGTKALEKVQASSLRPPHPPPPRPREWPEAQGPCFKQETLISIQKGAPHSLCGKSSALKSFRQKWAPRRATPVGLSRLPSMSSLSSEGSFLSSCKRNAQDSSPALHQKGAS